MITLIFQIKKKEMGEKYASNLLIKSFRFIELRKEDYKKVIHSQKQVFHERVKLRR